MNLIGTFATLAGLLGALFGQGPVEESRDERLAPSLAAALGGLGPDETIGAIVETRGPVADHTRAIDALGLERIWSYTIIDAFATKATADEVRALAEEPWVVHVWPDASVVPLMDVSTKDIQADRAWAGGYTGAGITVAVIDTGIELTDPDLADAIVDCVATIAGLTLPECNDTDGHGTHVAGTVASRDAMFPGVAPGAMIAAVRVLHAAGAGTTSDVIAGIEWVAEHKDDVAPPIRVATMSIGSANPGCGDGRDPSGRAADALVAQGVVFTVAAGNSGHKKCTVDGASAAKDVITVGAADDRNTATPFDDTLASFSSGGPTKDGRLKPELVAPGVGIRSLFLGPTIASLDGTSMATPHAAGTAALLLQKEPTLTAAEVKDRLLTSTIAPDAAGTLPDNDWGHGLLNACRSLALTGCAGP